MHREQGFPVPAAVFVTALLLFAGCVRQDISRADQLLSSGDFLEARRLYERAVRHEPESFDAHYGLGMSWCAEALYRTELGLAVPDDWFPAIYHLSRALGIRNDPHARATLAILHFNLGSSFRRRGEDALAIERLEQAVSYDSTLIKAHNLLGAIYHEHGRYDQAVRCYRCVLKNSPGYAMAHFNLGAASWALGDFRTARSHFSQAAEIEPHNTYYAGWVKKAESRIDN
jgi:tetratricopeptide (TPR) repeat protein